ncbi:MAG: hypothetical protein GDA44_04025 [Prochloron sp. SP5CPC1]|nr:hypothetical protein [Candidatus Paraprochloron terpiosi SP5CPC1]
MSKKKKRRKHKGPHYFREPFNYRGVNCKAVSGERARKQCRKWNKFVGKRSELLKQGLVAEAEQLEAEYWGVSKDDNSNETHMVLETELEETLCDVVYDGYLNNFYYR